MRKIIQIAYRIEGDSTDMGCRGCESYLVALCNDGTIWAWNYTNQTWNRIHQTPIPQPEGEEE